MIRVTLDHACSYVWLITSTLIWLDSPLSKLSFAEYPIVRYACKAISQVVEGMGQPQCEYYSSKMSSQLT